MEGKENGLSLRMIVINRSHRSRRWAVKKSAIFLLMLLVAMPVFARQGQRTAGHVSHALSAPRHIQPSSETVDLRGQEVLRFLWTRQGNSIYRRYYDFRIYKGYDPLADFLVYEKRLQLNEVFVDAKYFENGQVYTWSVRQVNRRGMKSRRNFSSFRVVK